MKRTSIVHAAAIVLAAIIATPAMAGDTQVGGKVFFDFSQTSVTKGGTETSKTGGNLTRTYLSAKNKLDDTWSVKLTLDSAQAKLKDSGGGTVTASKNTKVYVKKAQLTGEFIPEANVKLGVIGTPWVGYEDKLGKHRYISKSFVDTHKMDSSADAGVAVFGKIADGFAHYDVALVNGAGYGNIKATGAQDINTRVGIAPIEGLTLDLGYRTGYKGSKADSNDTTGTKETLTQFMATYGMGKTFRVGANYIQHDKGVNKGTGLETWAWMKFAGNLGGYVNYETYDSGKAGKVVETTTVASVDYQASKKVIMSLAYTGITDLKGKSGDKESKIGVYTQYKF